MSKEWICDPDEKFEALESAYYSIDSAIHDLSEIKDAQDVIAALREVMVMMEDLMDGTRTDCETVYQEMIREQTSDYWRSVI